MGFFISGNVYIKININVWHIIKAEPVFLMTKLHLLGSAVCRQLVPISQDDSLIWFRTCPRQKIKCNFYPGQLLTSVSFQFTRKTKSEERPQKWANFQRSQVIRHLDQSAGGEWVEITVKVTRERPISGKKKNKKNLFCYNLSKDLQFRVTPCPFNKCNTYLY